MEEYLIPASCGECEFTEKRSRFIGIVRNIESEEEARRAIDETRKKYYDARHTCWCYSVRAEGIIRYSDDGEPQGTAGQPMLEIFKRNHIENFCCTVTRYFGGVLLGAGGLVRAYSHTAKLALDSAGIACVRMWHVVETECSYAQFERVKQVISDFGGIIENTDYSQSVLITSLIPELSLTDFTDKLTDVSAGTVFSLVSSSRYMAVKIS